MTDENKLAQLEEEGHGNSLEALKLRGITLEGIREYITRLEIGGGEDTISMRRAKRILHGLLHPTKKKNNHKVKNR